jgi:hypothetical protein
MALVPRGMVATSGGMLLVGDVLLYSTVHAVDLVEVRTGCQYVQRFRVGVSQYYATSTLATAGEQGVAVLWQDYFEGSGTVMQRTLPPSLCESGSAATRATPDTSNAQLGTATRQRHK